MRIGIPAPNISRPSGKVAITEIARLAEQLDFDSLWLGDHVVWPSGQKYQRLGETPETAKYSGDLFDPFVTAGYLAGITERIKIGFGVIVVPYRNPVIAAKMLASLDQLSEGRILVGVGPGYMSGEFKALGVPRKRTGEQVDDFIEFLSLIAETDQPAFSGRTFDFESAFFRPQPKQASLPIWIGGVSAAAMQRALRWGNAWQLPGMSISQIRRPLAEFRTLAELQRRPMDDFTISARLRIRFASQPVSHEHKHAEDRIYDEASPHLEGPPRYLADQLARYSTELNIDHLVISVHEGDSLVGVLAAIERFGAEVLPHLSQI